MSKPVHRSFLRKSVTVAGAVLVALAGAVYLVLSLGPRWPEQLYRRVGESPVRGFSEDDPERHEIWRLYRRPGLDPEDFPIESSFGFGAADGRSGMLFVNIRHPWADSAVMRFLGDACGKPLTPRSYAHIGEALEFEGERWQCLDPKATVPW